MSDWYVLDAHHNVVGPVDLQTGAAFLEKRAERVVARTTIAANCDVSTVFLGLDHRFGPGAPLVFETLVFGGPCAGECDRYTTWVEAVEGHARMVNRCQAMEEGRQK